jgi:hypothetical protein
VNDPGVDPSVASPLALIELPDPLIPQLNVAPDIALPN